MSLRSLFIDFNSYFASVEQHDRAELRGLPVAVVPVEAESTCCIAASREAKQFGVKTGTRVSEARQLCPGLHVIAARPARYVELHHQLVKAVGDCAPIEEVLSIDEMHCELTGSFQKRESALALGREIKEAIRREIGPHMRSSIGIAPNPYLAKTATELEKVDGLVVIEQADLPGCLFDLELRDLHGIGRQMHERLRARGIRSVKALCEADKRTLRAVWGGIEGERMYDLLHGETVYRPPTKRSTIGHSHVLAPELRNERSALGVLHRLLQKAGTRLRREHFFAGGLGLSLKYLGDSHWSEDIRFTETQDTLLLTEALTRLWAKRPSRKPAPLLVGVTLFALTPADQHTPSLFHDARRDVLLAAMDELNQKMGKTTVFFGGAIEALDSAPMRIAFQRIPDKDTEA